MSKSIMSTVGKSGFELITIKDRVGCWFVQDRLCLIQTQLHQVYLVKFYPLYNLNFNFKCQINMLFFFSFVINNWYNRGKHNNCYNFCRWTWTNWEVSYLSLVEKRCEKYHQRLKFNFYAHCGKKKSDLVFDFANLFGRVIHQCNQNLFFFCRVGWVIVQSRIVHSQKQRSKIKLKR